MGPGQPQARHQEPATAEAVSAPMSWQEGSADMRPGFAVDGRVRGHVADAEFGGELPVG